MTAHSRGGPSERGVAPNHIGHRTLEVHVLLGQIIDRLNAFPDEIPITVDGAAKGITNAHSYRGAYDSIAVEPTDLRITVGDAKSVLSAAAGRVYKGWKGGWYAMTLTTPVYIAERGDVGELSRTP